MEEKYFIKIYKKNATNREEDPSYRVKGGGEMEDHQILDLYWARDSSAVRETEASYGRKLLRLAEGILGCREDAEECVNDTLLKGWETIPPQRPRYLYAYLAKICRYEALGKLDWRNAAKRKGNVSELTAELACCVSDSRLLVEDQEELGRVLSSFLQTLKREQRLVFLRRYWYTDSIKEISLRYGIGSVALFNGFKTSLL